MELSENYQADFCPQNYLQTYYADVNEFECLLESYHEFYTKYNTDWDSNSAAVLEFSGGPVIAYLISAAPYVKTITFSAYTEQERREVARWKNNEKDAHDWNIFFEYVIEELEEEPKSCQEERKKLLRQKIDKIVDCDISKAHPIDSNITEKFDIIHANSCLDAICKSLCEFISALKKLKMLLKPGGFLIVYVEERTTFYKLTDNTKWHVLSLSLVDIVHSFQEAGLEIVKIDRDYYSSNNIQSDAKGDVFIAGQKRKEE